MRIIMMMTTSININFKIDKNQDNLNLFFALKSRHRSPSRGGDYYQIWAKIIFSDNLFKPLCLPSKNILPTNEF